MAIPIKQQQAQIQAPTSQVGRAVDASRTVEPILKDSLRLTEAVGVFAQQLKINSDKSKVNEAIRVYYDEMTAAKDVFNQTQGQQTIDAVGNLNKAQDEALDKFNKSTSGISPAILNEARQKISGYNLTIREHNSMHLYKETQKVELANFEMSQDTKYEDFALAVDNFIAAGGTEKGLSGDIADSLENKLQSILDDAMSFYLSKGMPADYAFTQSKKDIDSNLSHTIDRVAQKYGNETALRVLDTTFVQNRMSEPARLQEYRQRETGMLSHMIFTSDPRILTKDGGINKKKIIELTPHLFDEERDIAIANALTAKNSGVSEQEKMEADNVAMMDKDYILNQRRNMGILQDKYVNKDAMFDKEAFVADQLSKLKTVTPGAIYDLLNHVEEMLNDARVTKADASYKNFLKEQHQDLTLKLEQMMEKGIISNDWSGAEQNWFSTKEIGVKDALFYIAGQADRETQITGWGPFKDYSRAKDNIYSNVKAISNFTRDANKMEIFNKIINRHSTTPINLETAIFNNLTDDQRNDVVEAFSRFTFYNGLLDNAQRQAYLQNYEAFEKAYNERNNVQLPDKTVVNRFNMAYSNVQKDMQDAEDMLRRQNTFSGLYNLQKLSTGGI